MNKQQFEQQINIDGNIYTFCNINMLQESGVADISRLPFSIRILVENIMRKLDLHSIVELTRYAAKLGIIDIDLWKE